MNLRKLTNYDIGIDLGTASVGWSVVDDMGEAASFNKKTAWGSRIFPSAQSAAETRAQRSQRRRYDRRRWRLDLLQALFEDEIGKVDPEFFVRLRQSRLLSKDKSYQAVLSSSGAARPLFADGEEEVEFYKNYPTIYHLRKALVEESEKTDIRYIYLAFHNIVKYRGNFLHQDNPGLSAANADMRTAVSTLCGMLDYWCDIKGLRSIMSQHKSEIQALLEGRTIQATEENGLSDTLASQMLSRKDTAGYLNRWIFIDSSEEADFDSKTVKAASKELASAIVGLKADFGKLFFLNETYKFSLSDDEQVKEFYSVCPDDGVALFEALCSIYSAYVLMGVLQGADGGTISCCKVASYDAYKQDLKSLKTLVKQYVPEKYDEFFRGDVFDEGKGYRSRNYDPKTAKGYTKYNAKRDGASYDDFKKSVEKLFQDTAAVNDVRYKSMMQRFSEGTFLRRLKTSDNGSIPYQLHLEEMVAIIENQKAYYPFLEADREKIVSLVTFRIPYYVGPLTLKNASTDNQGNLRFAWSKRLPGRESERIYPWNWEEVIDRKGSASAFMERLTGTCTYLFGEPVLPKCSLLYEEYCVLNELNGARYSRDGDKWYRFEYEDRMGIINDLFCRKKGSVKYSDVEKWLKREKGFTFVHVKGGQGETGFESRLSSYVFFKSVLGVEEIPENDIPMVEEIIHWNTLFEDRDILKKSIRDKYPDRLSDDQIKTIAKKRFSGWGRLSKKLLCGLKAQTDNGPCSIMDILREGNMNNDSRSETMVFMEVLRDDKLGFAELIEGENEKFLSADDDLDVNDLPGSPSIRRQINQALRIIDEVVGVVGHAPGNIYVEVTRDGDGRNKGNRTKRRYDAIKEAIKNLKKEHQDYYDAAVAGELDERNPAGLDDEKLALYFMQNGKCLYSGESLAIDQLDKYQVDHILPQSYVKDDSFENKALVKSKYNQRKADSLLLSDEIVRRMHPYWEALHAVKLIGDKKLKNLTRRSVGDKELGGFIARQIVETSQSMKLLSILLKRLYPDTNVLPVKAGFSSDLRKRLGLFKCRELNDYHHAHDAYLACQVGQFISKRHSGLYENPIGYSHAVKKFIESRAKYAEAHGKKMSTDGMPGSSSFVIDSFLTSEFDKETGEIGRDAWDADAAVGRIVKTLRRNDCYISRMPEERSGAFWDDTIYSPRSGKKLALPLKKGLDPKDYGSYSREQFAYFFIYEVVERKRKNKQKKYVFGKVPVRMAAFVSVNEGALAKYAKGLAEESGHEFVRIVRRKIYKYQLVEIGGNRLYVTGTEEVRNAVQLSLPSQMAEPFYRAVNGESIDPEAQLPLFDQIASKFSKYAVRLHNQLKLADLREKFIEASGEDRNKVLQELVSVFNGKVNMIDLSALGGGRYAGNMQINYDKMLNSGQNDFVLIDQSVTGMFEVRTRL